MMTLPMRLILDLTGLALVALCLAYWWLGNLPHELFGTALFALVIVHNVFNRRWYSSAPRNLGDGSRLLNAVTVACLALAMMVMLVTSVLISRDLFPFLSLDGAFAIREIHMFAAYWLLMIQAVHLGTRWTVVINVFRGTFGIEGPNVVRSVALRLLTFAAAAWGVRSTIEMGFGSKLMLSYTLDMWDFNESAFGFFLNYGSIVCLSAAVAHYVMSMLRRRKSGRGSGSSRKSRPQTAPDKQREGMR
ncbi:hypothetical protein B5K08_09305 [Rhizobium leguminosarum bv. trifolii]|uniref:Flavinylation-associated cytochrome domain-containing protein n=1 Tax=Rhizobium leguminosarum bv. trifolii TaxID=386 RepID=A0A3E1BR06_RHILT|nr:DUF4405 domain-containing protein [Rhizobium leguminosarum]RFB96554.1 hypothetical protein B5K08_09305 [Rhizobium leguminosarum bv. trifolii]RFB96677.1 hypothetical protein B5K10_09290 [Rhizobium leguminosarum bv. trifolii]